MAQNRSKNRNRFDKLSKKFEPLPEHAPYFEDAEDIELKPSTPLDLVEVLNKKWDDLIYEHGWKRNFWTKERRAEHAKDMVEMNKWREKYGNTDRTRRNGGKKRILSGPKKIRKHSGIHQTGGKVGKLKKGYKYSGKKLKKVKSKKVKRKNKK
tara:strand:- start:66 stop:524 length:459 start_codon:yes stop_codon:yes gene_type:complete